MFQWNAGFFNDKDRKVKDKCPVCRKSFGTSYAKTERVYYCEECKRIVEFHPFDETPRMVKKKEDSQLDKEYEPFEEDEMLRRIEWEELPPDDENPPPPPKGPRLPPWWI